jgi:hypothetical protein
MKARRAANYEGPKGRQVIATPVKAWKKRDDRRVAGPKDRESFAD